MTSEWKIRQAEISKLSSERRRLKDEENIIMDLLKVARTQLTQLEVESLELKARMRNEELEVPDSSVTNLGDNSVEEDDVKLDLSTKGVDIFMQLKAGGMLRDDVEEEEDEDDEN